MMISVRVATLWFLSMAAFAVPLRVAVAESDQQNKLNIFGRIALKVGESHVFDRRSRDGKVRERIAISPGGLRQVWLDENGDGDFERWTIAQPKLKVIASQFYRGKFHKVEVENELNHGLLRRVYSLNSSASEFKLLWTDFKGFKLAHGRMDSAFLSVRAGTCEDLHLSQMEEVKAILGYIRNAMTGSPEQKGADHAGIKCLASSLSPMLFDKSCSQKDWRESKREMIEGLADVLASMSKVEDDDDVYLNCLDKRGLARHSSEIRSRITAVAFQDFEALRKDADKFPFLNGPNGEKPDGIEQIVTRLVQYCGGIKARGNDPKSPQFQEWIKHQDEMHALKLGDKGERRLFVCKENLSSIAKIDSGAEIFRAGYDPDEHQIQIFQKKERMAKMVPYDPGDNSGYGGTIFHELMHMSGITERDEGALVSAEECCTPGSSPERKKAGCAFVDEVVNRRRLQETMGEHLASAIPGLKAIENILTSSLGDEMSAHIMQDYYTYLDKERVADVENWQRCAAAQDRNEEAIRRVCDAGYAEDLRARTEEYFASSNCRDVDFEELNPPVNCKTAGRNFVRAFDSRYDFTELRPFREATYRGQNERLAAFDKLTNGQQMDQYGPQLYQTLPDPNAKLSDANIWKGVPLVKDAGEAQPGDPLLRATRLSKYVKTLPAANDVVRSIASDGRPHLGEDPAVYTGASSRDSGPSGGSLSNATATSPLRTSRNAQENLPSAEVGQNAAARAKLPSTSGFVASDSGARNGKGDRETDGAPEGVSPKRFSLREIFESPTAARTLGSVDPAPIGTTVINAAAGIPEAVAKQPLQTTAETMARIAAGFAKKPSTAALTLPAQIVNPVNLPNPSDRSDNTDTTAAPSFATRATPGSNNAQGGKEEYLNGNRDRDDNPTGSTTAGAAAPSGGGALPDAGGGGFTPSGRGSGRQRKRPSAPGAVAVSFAAPPGEDPSRIPPEGQASPETGAGRGPASIPSYNAKPNPNTPPSATVALKGLIPLPPKLRKFVEKANHLLEEKSKNPNDRSVQGEYERAMRKLTRNGIRVELQVHDGETYAFGAQVYDISQPEFSGAQKPLQKITIYQCRESFQTCHISKGMGQKP